MIISSRSVPVEANRPEAIGKNGKFDNGGAFLPFSGNTIICTLSPENPLYPILEDLHAELRRQEFSSQHALLPPTSWHMTLLEGVCDRFRTPDRWPHNLQLDAPIHACSTLFARELSTFNLNATLPIRMALADLTATTDGTGVRLEPADAAEADKIRTLRDRLADALQLRLPDHDAYSFHISITYLLYYLDERQQNAISRFLQDFSREKLPDFVDFGAPESSTFDDMSAYRCELPIENTGKRME